MDKQILDNADDTTFTIVTESGDDKPDNLVKSNHEIQEIQKDLNSLMDCIKSFVAENPDYIENDEEFDANIYREEDDIDLNDENITDISEKDDLRFVENMYALDKDNSSVTLNWEAMEPLFSNIVSDLSQLQSLHVQTNSVVERIRKLSEQAEKN